MWLAIIIIILLLYIIIVAVRFSRVGKTVSFNYVTAPPQLGNLPSVDQYETCYDPFGNIRYNIWYDPNTNRTYTIDGMSSTNQIVAKYGSQYVYLLSDGRISCFPPSSPLLPSLLSSSTSCPQ